MVPAVIPRELAAAIAAEVEGAPVEAAVRRRAGGTYAIRGLLRLSPAAREAAALPAVRALVEAALGPGAAPARGLLLDKHPGANWSVGWHQDVTIAVRERREAPGFERWSLKARVPHVQPPVAVLEGMLAVRLHLDDCGEEDGPLRVLPGTHRLGRLEPEQIRALRAERAPVACPAPAGAAVLMRPLLLHGSAAARRPGRRRVAHLEFAAGPLPGGLEWSGE